MKHTPEKKDWFALFTEGDAAAFNHYFEQYNKMLHFIAIQKLKEKEITEEIVSDAFQKLWLNREKIASEEHIKAFLLRVNFNGCINHLKQEERKATMLRELGYLQEDAVDHQLILDEIEAELLGRIWQAMDNLPDKCGTIFRLIFIEGLSTKEVAEELNITERNVLSQKSRAIQLLRNVLVPQNPDPFRATG